VVVDDESLPIAGANVGIVETNAQTSTDPAGRFTFNELEPGTYRVIVERLGFEGTARKTDVVAGEVTDVSISLKTLNVDDVPYYTLIPRNVLFHVDNWFASQYADHIAVYSNQSAVNGLKCSPCTYVLHIEPSPESVATEVRWTPSGNPAVNPDVQLWYNKDWSDTSAGAYVCGQFIQKQPFSQIWPDACVANAKKVDKIKLYFLGSAYGISIEHKVESYTTFAYNGELPDGYTALPPP
jgi:hypothetical protein